MQSSETPTKKIYIFTHNLQSILCALSATSNNFFYRGGFYMDENHERYMDAPKSSWKWPANNF